MELYGNCPVQGCEVREGWLLYFRARDGWSLRAWKPGTWTPMPAGSYSTAAEQALTATLAADVEPTIVVDDTYQGVPEPDDTENEYPGWWSEKYANEVAEWAALFVLPF